MKPRTDPSILLRRYWENPDTPVVTDAGDLERQMTRLLRHPDTRREMGEAGFAAVAARQGAVAQTLALVERVLVDGHAPRESR